MKIIELNFLFLRFADLQLKSVKICKKISRVFKIYIYPFIPNCCGCGRLMSDLYLRISIQLTPMYLHIYVYIYIYTFVAGGEI